MNKQYQNLRVEAIKAQQKQPQAQFQPEEQFWTEHRTTLISYEAQFVNSFRPECTSQANDAKRSKSKKKNSEYQGGFLFPGRPGDNEEDIPSVVLSSKFHALRQLFSAEANASKEDLKLREFVRILLELKHSVILRQFLQIYQVMIRQIKEVKFQAIREQANRFTVLDDISNKVASFIQQCPFLFDSFTSYLKENTKETIKLFKVTAYCLLAEKHRFTINQFYCQAFDIQDLQDSQGKLPKKKKKIDPLSDQDS